MRLALRLSGALHAAKYRLYHAVKRRSGINTAPRDFKVLVSLSTYPPRLPRVFLAVESLLNQTFKPDRIILWLASNEVAKSDIPASLRKQEARGLEIRYVDDNIKSYKKLIPAVEAFGDHHIVTADDDFMFPAWWLRRLYRAHQRHPDCIATYRGARMQRRGERQLRPYLLWSPADSAARRPLGPSHDIFPTGGCGAWYPPRALDAMLTERLFMTLCPDADDIWFKAMGLRAQTRAVMARRRSLTFPLIHQTQAQSLWETNRRANDAKLKAVFDHFDLYRLISRADVKCADDLPLRPSRVNVRVRKRIFDVALGIASLPVLVPALLLIALLIKATSRGEVIYWSRRVGRGGVIFNMPKFRTLKSVTATATAAATDDPPGQRYESTGRFLRYTSLDELPQIYSILKGDMSFVGPRPIEPQEEELISLRSEKEIDSITPGLTGWAQINGRDRLSITEKVQFDLEYAANQSLWMDIKILCITFALVIKRKNILF